MKQTHSTSSVQVCKTCNNEFEIRDADMIFYEQVKTVPPLYCPDCRMARRLMFRNERTFYKRSCDLCKKDFISVYPKESEFTVYCYDCWWSDDWDPKSYGKNYDSGKPFFEQYKELIKETPRLGIMIHNNVRSDYTNGSAENKDCFTGHCRIAGADQPDCFFGT